MGRKQEKQGRRTASNTEEALKRKNKTDVMEIILHTDEVNVQ